jgi:SP family general alpha glucoside:H+ symporter-like MFS transporter
MNCVPTRARIIEVLLRLQYSFAGLTAVGVLWSYFYVPETVGRSAVEIDLLFQARVSARKFADADVKDLNLSSERDV